ncbi:MAG: inositol monophosphatase [Candidatus Saccharimonadales bacterium]
MTKEELTKYADFAEGLAHQAGNIMLSYFRSSTKTTTWKPDNSPVTQADLEINTLVINEVKRSYPDHGVLGEEEAFAIERRILWVVDPIDGTAPYDLGMPNSTFCLALVVDGMVMVSVVHDPFSKRLFSATRGAGAYVNGKKITCNKNGSLAQRYAFVPTGSKEEPHLFESFIKDLKKRGSKTLFIPSFTYLATLVLEGSASGALMSYGSPWDAAAISLIAEEAGATASDLLGNRRSYSEWGDGILITNSASHQYYVDGIAHARARH